MTRGFHEDQQFKKEFLQIVDAHGGENCRHWTKVARVYFETTGIQVNQTYKLRKRWETLTGYKENLSEEQAKILYETGIKCRGNNKGGLQNFTQQTGVRMYLGRYTKTISKWLRGAIKLFQEMYIHDKKTRYRRLDEDNYRLSYVSIHIMLRAVDVNDIGDDPIFQELKQCAIKLEQLLLLHAQIHKEFNKRENYENYEIYKNLLRRWQFRRIMFFLDYVNELKQISISYYKELVILAHPLLKQSIELNKKTEIYQKIILESDWQSKYQLYNLCQGLQENQEYSMLIKKASKKQKDQTNKEIQDNLQDVEQNIENENVLQGYDVVSKSVHKVCNKMAHARITPTEKQKLRTFRGHYVRPGQIKSKGWTTILFDHDLPSSQDEKEIEDQQNFSNLDMKELSKIYNSNFDKDILKLQGKQRVKKQKKNKPYAF
ncbi:unnamed protein product [Paramecium pentaurelia]|uniref:Uncharacterized protein n=1 Tax=Paramecium pentaurelia TaxID=43138 RepID=A0A8S1U278_9CILI|nr:unnamed protein product [Paramecium pentaurelia]